MPIESRSDWIGSDPITVVRYDLLPTKSKPQLRRKMRTRSTREKVSNGTKLSIVVLSMPWLLFNTVCVVWLLEVEERTLVELRDFISFNRSANPYQSLSSIRIRHTIQIFNHIHVGGRIRHQAAVGRGGGFISCHCDSIESLLKISHGHHPATAIHQLDYRRVTDGPMSSPNH